MSAGIATSVIDDLRLISEVLDRAKPKGDLPKVTEPAKVEPAKAEPAKAEPAETADQINIKLDAKPADVKLTEIIGVSPDHPLRIENQHASCPLKKEISVVTPHDASSLEDALKKVCGDNDTVWILAQQIIGEIVDRKSSLRGLKPVTRGATLVTNDECVKMVLDRQKPSTVVPSARTSEANLMTSSSDNAVVIIADNRNICRILDKLVQLRGVEYGTATCVVKPARSLAKSSLVPGSKLRGLPDVKNPGTDETEEEYVKNKIK